MLTATYLESLGILRTDVMRSCDESNIVRCLWYLSLVEQRLLADTKSCVSVFQRLVSLSLLSLVSVQ